jgi:hypothetical protein
LLLVKSRRFYRPINKTRKWPAFLPGNALGGKLLIWKNAATGRVNAMSHKLFFAVSLAAVFLAVGCSRLVGSGRVITETRQVSGVNAVSLGGVGELTIVQGEPASLVIEAEDNIMPQIRTHTKNGLLEISEKGSVSPTKPIRFQLTVSQLSKIFSAGAASVHVHKLTSPGLLELRVEGAGSVNISQVECASVKVVVSGAGDITIQGRTRDQQVELSGAGKYRAGDLRTQATRLEVSGAGNATVWAMSDLDVTIDGVGDVHYYGSPKIKQEINGVGSLHALGDKPRE